MSGGFGTKIKDCFLPVEISGVLFIEVLESGTCIFQDLVDFVHQQAAALDEQSRVVKEQAAMLEERNSSVAELKVRVETLEGTATDHETRISTVETDVNGKQ